MSRQVASIRNRTKKKVTVKVGMIGDSQIGKTSLMVKYVEGAFNDDYIQTLGVNFMEKTIALKSTDITFSIWDLGGQQEYLHMLPLVCNDAVALLFMFDLSRKSTLTSVKNWYKQARLLNKTAYPLLIGTKYDYFMAMKMDERAEMTTQARRFARAMKAPLIFCSAAQSINIQKIFKIVLAAVFDLTCTVEQILTVGDPIVEYEHTTIKHEKDAGAPTNPPGGSPSAATSTGSNSSGTTEPTDGGSDTPVGDGALVRSVSGSSQSSTQTWATPTPAAATNKATQNSAQHAPTPATTTKPST